jgi:hypothetical protein
MMLLLNKPNTYILINNVKQENEQVVLLQLCERLLNRHVDSPIALASVEITFVELYLIYVFTKLLAYL